MTDTTAPDIVAKGARVGRAWTRCVEAVPAPLTVLAGSALWGVLIAAASLGGHWLHHGFLTLYPALGALYLSGGALAFAPGLWLCNLLFHGSRRDIRLAGGTVVMALATHTMTAGLFAL